MSEIKTYQDILSCVVENARLIRYTPEELEEEIAFEARERGLSDDEINAAVAYAFDQARSHILSEALEDAIIAAQEAAQQLHPNPSLLWRDTEIQDPYRGILAIIGDSWNFWPEHIRDKAFRAAEETFRSKLPWNQRFQR